MPRERLYLFDTTLRDGAQTNGVDFSLGRQARDRRACSDELGIDYVEGGYPGANPTDTTLFAEPRACDADLHRLRHDQPARALGLERSGLAALLDAKADAICFVAKTWDYHVRVALGTTHEENLASIRDSVARRQAEGPRGAARLRAFLRRLQGQSGLSRWPAPRPPTRPARAGWCCATPMAARCRTRSRRSSARSPSTSPAITSASTPTTTPSRRSPIRWRRCAPARARSRAR